MTDDAIRAVEAMGDEVEDEGETQLLEEFNTAADALPGHLDSLGDADKLRFYGLFKQATVGKCNTSRPGFFDWKGRAKWDAWNSLGDMMRSEAMMEYIDLLNERVPGWNSSKAGRNKAAMGPVCRCLFLRKRTLAGARADADDADEGPLWATVREGKDEEAQRILSSGQASVSDRSPNGELITPLHLAADAGHLGVVRVLLKHGADPNAQDAAGQTPLHCAVLCGHEEVARALVGAGADPGVADDDGCPPSEHQPSWAWLTAT